MIYNSDFFGFSKKKQEKKQKLFVSEETRRHIQISFDKPISLDYLDEWADHGFYVCSSETLAPDFHLILFRKENADMEWLKEQIN